MAALVSRDTAHAKGMYSSPQSRASDPHVVRFSRKCRENRQLACFRMQINLAVSEYIAEKHDCSVIE